MRKIYPIDKESKIIVKDNITNSNEIITLKKINCFIGSNNAGKSRTLRHIITNDYPPLKTINLSNKEDVKITKYQNIYRITKTIINNLLNYDTSNYTPAKPDEIEDTRQDYNGKIYKEIYIEGEERCDAINFLPEYSLKIKKIYEEHDLNNNNTNINFYIIEKVYEVIIDLLDSIIHKINLISPFEHIEEDEKYIEYYRYDHEEIEYYSQLNYNPFQIIFNNIKNISTNNKDVFYLENINKNKLLKLIEDINISKYVWIYNLYNSTYIYIPILRALRKLNDTDVFLERTHKDYEIPTEQIFTGLNIFSEIKKWLLGNRSDRNKVNEFEDFLSKHLFDNQEISITVPETHGSDVVNIKIGNAQERPIYSLGDGIQQLIILLFPFFNTKEEKDITICIEEPETHLHPKWQKLFIDIIATEFPNHYVFFTTHSNVFINHEAIDLYKVEKDFNENNEEVTMISKAIDNDKKELLAELGYQASDVLGHNYTLLVEGPSDKIFIEKFISTYSNGKLQIDNHYNVLPFHGKGNLKKHYGIDNEPINLEKLNHNFGIVVDSDLNHTETNTLKNKLNSINKLFWCTHGGSIENTIPRKIWIKALVEDEQVIYYDNNKKIDDLTKVNSFEEERYSKINEKKYSDVKSILNSLSITLTQEQSSILDNKITENNKLKKGFFRSDDSKILQVDKVKIAHQVTSNYPANKEELLQSPELAYYIPKLCKAIYKANGMIEEANAISDEDLETAKKALEEAIEAEDKKVKQAISGHQPKQQQNIIESKIDEELKP